MRARDRCSNFSMVQKFRLDYGLLLELIIFLSQLSTPIIVVGKESRSCEAKIKKSEKPGSHREGVEPRTPLVRVTSALPLSHDSWTTTNLYFCLITSKFLHFQCETRY